MGKNEPKRVKGARKGQQWEGNGRKGAKLATKGAKQDPNGHKRAEMDRTALQR